MTDIYLITGVCCDEIICSRYKGLTLQDVISIDYKLGHIIQACIHSWKKKYPLYNIIVGLKAKICISTMNFLFPTRIYMVIWLNGYMVIINTKNASSSKLTVPDQDLQFKQK